MCNGNFTCSRSGGSRSLCGICSFSSEKVVRLAGLEPARVAPLPPQSSVSANSTISATTNNQAGRREVRKGIYFPGLMLPHVSVKVFQFMTLTEKILARAADKAHVEAGDNIWVKADI